MRIALIGYGNIAKKHLEVFRHLGCEIVASCNRSEAGNKLAHEEGAIPHTYTNMIEMLDIEKPDAIIVCVSFDQIYTVSKVLIPYKIPMLIEKPAGTSVTELEELTDLTEKHGTIVQVALNRRHYSVIQQALKDMGGTDKITSVSIEWSEDPDKGIRTRKYTDKQVEQLIYANSIHGIDTLLYLAGTLAEESIYTKKIDSKFRCMMQLSGISNTGKLIHFSSSWNNFVPWRIVISATDSRYVFAPLETCIKYNSVSEPINIEPHAYDVQFKAGFYEQAKHFLQIIAENKVKHDHDLDSCLPGMKLAEKFYTKIFPSTKSLS